MTSQSHALRICENAFNRTYTYLCIYLLLYSKRLTLPALLISNGGHHHFEATVHSLRFRVESQVGDLSMEEDCVGNAAAETPFARKHIRVFLEYFHEVRLTFIRPLQLEFRERQLDLEIVYVSHQVHTTAPVYHTF